MLKKFDVGMMGVVLFVVLMIAVATFNVGSVGTSPIDKNGSAGLKFITKYVPGYGNVTAREDMFVGEGNNTKVIRNSDYKEAGVITPKYEKFPEVEFITVDTPYGKVNVTPEMYKTLGVEKITANQKEFMDNRNDLIKKGLINTASTADTVLPLTDSATVDATVSKVQPAATASSVYTREDWGYGVRSGYTPNYLYGRLNPVSGSSLPSGVTCYDEYELTMNSAGETLEFISDHTGSNRKVWACMWDDHYPNGVSYVPWSSVSGPIEFYYNYNTANNRIDIVFYNSATGVTVPFQFTDTTLGTAITYVDASTELYYPSPIPTFRSDSTLEQWIARSSSTYYNPTDVFQSNGRVTNNQYVYVSSSAVSGHYVTSHASGSAVA